MPDIDHIIACHQLNINLYEKYVTLMRCCHSSEKVDYIKCIVSKHLQANFISMQAQLHRVVVKHRTSQEGK